MNAGASPGPSTGVTLWSLVEARARLRPTRCSRSTSPAVRSRSREYRARGGAGRSGARRARRGRRRHACRGSSRPGSRRSCSSAALAGSARCRTRCCRSTASARSDSSWARSGRELAGRRRGVARVRPRRAADAVVAEAARRSGSSCQRADVRPHAPARATRHAAAAAGRRRCAALGVLLVGHDGRSEGRAALATRRSSPDPAAVAERYELDESTATRWCSRSRTSAAIGMLVVQLLTGVRRDRDRAVRRRAHAAVPRRARRDDRRRRNAARDALPPVPARDIAEQRVFPDLPAPS